MSSGSKEWTSRRTGREKISLLVFIHGYILYHLWDFIYLDYFQKSSMTGRRERQEAFLKKFDLGDLDDQMVKVAEEHFTELEVKEDLIEDADRVHIDAWREIGACRFALSVISNGYRVPFTSFPSRYKEKNNKSFRDNEKGGVDQVLVLLKQKRIMEVDQADVLCCNPLSVAVNAKGKKRLVIDLSRHVNLVVDKKTFKIESTESALDIIEKGSWSVSFDIRGAYHHVKLAEDQWKYFGFCCFIEGRLRYFWFMSMPFGLSSAAYALTKLLKSVLARWRTMGFLVWIHIDDGLVVMKSRGEAETASKIVQKDLKRLGIIVSDEKCVWKPCQQQVWTGLLFDLEEFKVFVTEDKISRAKGKLLEMKGKDIKFIPI